MGVDNLLTLLPHSFARTNMWDELSSNCIAVNYLQLSMDFWKTISVKFKIFLTCRPFPFSFHSWYKHLLLITSWPMTYDNQFDMGCLQDPSPIKRLLSIKSVTRSCSEMSPHISGKRVNWPWSSIATCNQTWIPIDTNSSQTLLRLVCLCSCDCHSPQVRENVADFKLRPFWCLKSRLLTIENDPDFLSPFPFYNTE